MKNRYLRAARWLCCCGLLAALPPDNHACAEAPLPAGYIDEAPLPEGFPPPSEVGKIVEKEYPLARSYSATGRGAFMKCFSYLSLKGHKMTAPVVMEYRTPEESAKAAKSLMVDVERMHFVLEKPAQDKPQKAALVEVADMPKMRVLSIAHQGRLSAETVTEAEMKLAKALQARPELAADGETRILGYNSPAKADKGYWEVQLPVKDAKP